MDTLSGWVTLQVLAFDVVHPFVTALAPTAPKQDHADPLHLSSSPSSASPVAITYLRRFAWREEKPRKIDETKGSDSGEGLMETLAVHPGGAHFVMSGRLRGGSWNTALFGLADGALLHSLKTDTRITKALFAADGKRMVLAGTQRQPNMKDGVVPAFGHVDVYDVTVG
jgi:hypothetical protein